jgi:hypothetical protein
MQTVPGRPRGSTRPARALGLDGNPLRRASDRAEAWIRIGLLAVFLIAGPMAALGAGGWAYVRSLPAAAWPPGRLPGRPSGLSGPEAGHEQADQNHDRPGRRPTP